MRVTLFTSCIVDQFFPEVAFSAVKVLRKLGCEVDCDESQTCCGQPAFNSGFPELSRPVAARFCRLYETSPSAVICLSGSCTAMVRHFVPGLFPAGSDLERISREVASRTFEFSEFLVRVLAVEGTGARFEEKVTYHDSCHALRELGLSDAPRRLIHSVEGIQLREMKAADRCCGFGGAFSVKFDDVSSAMAMEKIEGILETGADFVVSTDMGCLMQIDGLLRRNRIPVRTLHLAEVLANF